METLLASLPYGIKSIWQAAYFEKEFLLCGGIVLLLGIIYLYRFWKLVETESQNTPKIAPKTNWKARYQTLNIQSPDFAKRVELLLIEYTYDVLGIALQSSLTTEEKSQLLDEPDIIECLRISRHIRYTSSDKITAHAESLDQIAQRIFR